MPEQPQSPKAPAHTPLFGVRISLSSIAELVEQMIRPPLVGGGARLVATMNLDHVVRLQHSPDFQAAYDHAWNVTIDGTPVWLYARLKGLQARRCTGADLLAALIPALRPKLHRPFFVVSNEATGDRLMELLAAQGFAPQAIGYACPPMGFEDDPQATDALCATIRSHRATHLIFGLGAPKSEIWIDQHRRELGDLYACAVGSGPNFLVGTSRRAPRALRDMGLEWAWRFAHDRRRLFRRYFVDSWGFIPAVVRDLTHRDDEELAADARLDNP